TMKKQRLEDNLKKREERTPRICVEEHAYACYTYFNPRLGNSITLRRGNSLHQSHAYA
ncbi:hypothetical protein PIB30_091804, partial [Stylosanthes scabra]|nr:hypothetical protein [Stylosanthes scabra]